MSKLSYSLFNCYWRILAGFLLIASSSFCYCVNKTFFVKENGIDIAITNAIEAIVACLRSEDQYCVSVPEEGLSLRSLGM